MLYFIGGEILQIDFPPLILTSLEITRVFLKDFQILIIIVEFSRSLFWVVIVNWIMINQYILISALLVIVSNFQCGLSRSLPNILNTKLLNIKNTDERRSIFRLRGGANDESESKTIKGPCIGIDLGTTYRY